MREWCRSVVSCSCEPLLCWKRNLIRPCLQSIQRFWFSTDFLSIFCLSQSSQDTTISLTGPPNYLSVFRALLFAQGTEWVLNNSWAVIDMGSVNCKSLLSPSFGTLSQSRLKSVLLNNLYCSSVFGTFSFSFHLIRDLPMLKGHNCRLLGVKMLPEILTE